MIEIFSPFASWNFVLLFSLFNTIIIFLYIKINHYNILSVSNFFLLAFWLCFYVGFLLAFFSNYFFKEFSLSLKEVVATEILISICLYVYLLIFIVCDIIVPNFRFRLFLIPNKKIFIRILSFLLFSVASISIIIYLWKNNGFVLLKSTGYLDRYEKNIGLGLITLMITMYIPANLLIYLIKPVKSRFYISLIIAIIFGLLSFFAIGGYRQLLLMGIISLFFYNIYHSGISYTKVFTYSVLGVVILFYLAVIRYDIDLNQNLVGLFIVFTQDSLSPFNSFTKIIEYIDSTSDFQNIKLFLGHFQIVVPRMFWENKPELILNSGNFFTQNVLNYKSALTISPTLAGEFYLMRGVLSLFFGFILIAVMNVILERVVVIYKENNMNGILQNTFFFASIFNSFWLVREGLEVYIYRMSRMYILFWFFIFITYLIYYQLKGRSLKL